MKLFRCDALWQPQGWLSPAVVGVDDAGSIAWLSSQAPETASDVETVRGVVVPGMPNLHSHAFQRAMAGLAEHGVGDDSFWTWRDAMYRLVERVEPEDVQAIAAQLYVEMLEAGYTAVGEFHYLHHDTGGKPYTDRAELSRRIVAAASDAGIGLTLLPTAYASGGFGGAPVGTAQRRFVDTVEGLFRIVGAVREAASPNLRVGLALHSLRAVPPRQIEDCVSALHALDATAPVHVHVAEQLREVEECVAHTGRRPVQWLLDEAPVDRRWCLVHATHVDDRELERIAQSGAVVGLCPTTEANLGDGVAPAAELLTAGARIGIGSDSHVSVSVTEELRWLEYAQRLVRRRRNVLSDLTRPSTGQRLLQATLEGGAQALARPIGTLAVGSRADLVVLDPDHAALHGRPLSRVLDAWIFASSTSPVRDVMVGGVWCVQGGRHRQRDAIFAAYRRSLARIAGEI